MVVVMVVITVAIMVYCQLLLLLLLWLSQLLSHALVSGVSFRAYQRSAVSAARIDALQSARQRLFRPPLRLRPVVE